MFSLNPTVYSLFRSILLNLKSPFDSMLEESMATCALSNKNAFASAGISSSDTMLNLSKSNSGSAGSSIDVNL